MISLGNSRTGKCDHQLCISSFPIILKKYIYFFNKQGIHLTFFFRVQVIVSGELDYSDKLIQNEVELLTQTFENTSYVSGNLYTESWLRTFVQYAERNSDYLNISISDQASFLAALKEVFTPNA